MDKLTVQRYADLPDGAILQCHAVSGKGGGYLRIGHDWRHVLYVCIPVGFLHPAAGI